MGGGEGLNDHSMSAGSWAVACKNNPTIKIFAMYLYLAKYMSYVCFHLEWKLKANMCMITSTQVKKMSSLLVCLFHTSCSSHECIDFDQIFKDTLLQIKLIELYNKHSSCTIKRQ